MHDHPFEALAARVRQRPLAVAILLFPEVEVLDFAGPFEVFSVASRVALRGALPTHPAFTVQTVAATPALVAARHGLQVLPAASFADAAPCDVLIVPGGVVTQPLGDDATLAWVAETAGRASLTASVCTGAFILARAGLLGGGPVTTHWEDVADLRAGYPRLEVVEGVPFVERGSIFTSAGISAGIGMSLHLVGRILGAELARATARQMQYDWVETAV
ncbi:DJ-1/PfpI family protein [Pseudomonas benzenivorans]|uniref:DJ-1/PfpI family protein n=1 Tax=Pseudomonas benzenivorans TaxID=556533 RepID=A0ABY5H4K2_9PSED|nr:DJ-1/PfpI family protein [Pseudomonas benzenivorans]UTW07028.1 DJ-1/PfpI family protein [Pseudomonas benzenivorans]